MNKLSLSAVVAAVLFSGAAMAGTEQAQEKTRAEVKVELAQARIAGTIDPLELESRRPDVQQLTPVAAAKAQATLARAQTTLARAQAQTSTVTGQ